MLKSIQEFNWEVSQSIMNVCQGAGRKICITDTMDEPVFGHQAWCSWWERAGEGGRLAEHLVWNQDQNTSTSPSLPSFTVEENRTVKVVQFSSVAQSCPTLCDPMNRSTPGLPVHHQLPEFTQPHVHQVGDAIQPSHPLSSPSPPAPNPSQHHSLFQWVSSSHEVANVLEFQL